jgi:hypothetical protein
MVNKNTNKKIYMVNKNVLFQNREQEDKTVLSG